MLNKTTEIPTETLRVAAYARVSTDKDDQTNSFESQVRYFTDYISRQENWHLVKVYSDEGTTGTTTRNRAGFNAMIDDAFAGRIDYIITKEVSRFARNTVDTLQVTRALKEKGIGVYFMLDNINTLDKDGEIRLTLIASLAQEESRKTSERVKWGQKRQMEKGVVFGRSLLGYRVEKGKLFIKEDEAETVKLIFEKYVYEEKGTHVIARELKEAGIRPYDPDGRAKHKTEWSSTAILRILRNEKYVGDLKQKKTCTENFLDHKRRRNRGQEEMIFIRDHHPESAIIPRQLWDAAQNELMRRTAASKQNSYHTNKHWASGKIFCGVCGKKFVSRTKKAKHSESLVWSCINHVKSTAFREENCSLSEWANDRSLRRIVLFILSKLTNKNDSLYHEIASDISKLRTMHTPTKAETIRLSMERLENKKQKLIDIRLADEISAEDFKTKKREIESDLSKLFAKLEEFQNSENTIQTPDARQEVLLAKALDLLSFSDETADLLLRTTLEHITIHAGHEVVVKLYGLTQSFRVRYKSSGRGMRYKTEILDAELVHN